jgi:phage/plasmid-like protein (TIGR03299 family)
MAHNIALNATTGKHMMFTAGKLPWHELGQNVSEAQTWKAAMQLAGLDWEAHAIEISTPYGAISTHRAIVRSDQPALTLGIVGNDYQPIQNRQAFEWTEALLETGALYESAGALGNGERVWVLARVPQADFAIGDDQHMGYLLFETSHNGTKAATAKMTDVRVVCQNTLNMALSGGGTSLRIRHTKSADDRFQSALKMITETQQTSATLSQKLQKLARRNVSRVSIDAIFDRLYPAPDVKADAKRDNGAHTRRENLLTSILENFERNDGNAFPEQRGTAYAMLNAITDYTDHSRINRSTSRTGDLGANALRARSAMFGMGARLKEQALDVVLELTNGETEIQTVYSSAPTGGSLLDQMIAEQSQN